MAVVPGTSPLPRVCRVTPAQAYPGRCRSVRDGVLTRGDDGTSPYMVAEVFPPSDGGIFAWTDSLRPELPYFGEIIWMGLYGIPEDSPVVAKGAKNIPEVLECCSARVKDGKVFLCAQEFSHESWEALLNAPLFWGTIMDLPWTQGGSPARGELAENFPENQRKSPAQGTEADEAQWHNK